MYSKEGEEVLYSMVLSVESVSNNAILYCTEKGKLRGMVSWLELNDATDFGTRAGLPIFITSALARADSSIPFPALAGAVRDRGCARAVVGQRPAVPFSLLFGDERI